MQLTTVNHFNTKFSVSLPDPEKVDVVRNVEFTAKFKCPPQSKDSIQKLRDLQEEEGSYGFLEKILIDIESNLNDLKTTDENGEPITLLECFKQNMILSNYAIGAYWDVVNKGLRGKNSKR